MQNFVDLTIERIKLLKARYLLTQKQQELDNDLSLITNIDIQSVNQKLENIV